MPSKRNLFKENILPILAVIEVSIFCIGLLLRSFRSDSTIFPNENGRILFPLSNEEKTSENKTVDSDSLHSKPYPVRLEIDGLKINLPITKSKIVNGVWEISKDGVSHLDISSNPGENGNIVLYGHNKRAILGSLPYLATGAKIRVITEDHKTYTYEVFAKRKIEKTDVSIALATPSEVLTIYTCDAQKTKRFVIQAKPI